MRIARSALRDLGPMEFLGARSVEIMRSLGTKR
jgi:hypothetical protein